MIANRNNRIAADDSLLDAGKPMKVSLFDESNRAGL